MATFPLEATKFEEEEEKRGARGERQKRWVGNEDPGREQGGGSEGGVGEGEADISSEGFPKSQEGFAKPFPNLPRV